jgi:glycogen debranching enzyme
MNDDDADGLVRYKHPYSSGMDDSPLWDHGLPVESLDIKPYLCIQMDALAVIVEALDRFDEADTWRQRALEVAQRMVKDLYDPEVGLFWATHDHIPIPEITLLNLFPLWTDHISNDIQEKILAHLTNPDKFWTNYPPSTVARNSRSYEPDTMWRGPTWLYMNYIFTEVLTKIGHSDLADKLKDQTLALIAQSDGFYEFYNSETGQPGSGAAPMFGWTAVLFIDLVQQVSRGQTNL